MSQDELKTFMGNHWLLVEDGCMVIGINEDGLEEITEITSVSLPNEKEDVSADEICGEIETEEGPLNIYSPIDGKVAEINQAVVDNPELILEDPFGEGWLIKIEPNDESDLDLDAIEDDEEEDDEDEEEDDE